MDKITGNFLTQTNKDFPLDCETLDILQGNMELLGALGNIAGDKLILSGCKLSEDGLERGQGYLFLRTRTCPHGEVLRWEGGNISGGMYIRLEDIPVTAQGYEFPKAYTRRTLAPGVGEENFEWKEFRKPKSSAELESLISALAKEIAELNVEPEREPLGIVKMWAGVELPQDYGLCDGQALKIADYPALYAAIGTVFNSAVNCNGSRLQTAAGYFRLPDLRGRFVVGYNDQDDDYGSYGSAGGEKRHLLSEDEMPRHRHGQQLWAEASGLWKGGGQNSTPNSTSWHDRTVSFGKTDESGGGAGHENRPPYYALAYIMKLK